MPFKKMNLSYMKIVYNILFVSFLVNFCFSQENSKKNFESKIKIDGVSAVVGDYVILGCFNSKYYKV